MSEITVGSVCSGYGGAELAFAGLAQPVFMSEIEPFPRAILTHRFPHVPLLGDFTQMIADPRLCDILAGGTPCQAFSVAGNRRSLEDARGNLALAFVMLLDSIDELRGLLGMSPAACLFENVPGILSVKDNAFGCFLAQLVGGSGALNPPGRGGKWPRAGMVAGPRRSAAWRTLDAQFAGVAQRRRRVFVVASARKGFDPSAVLFELEGVQRHLAPSRQAGEGTPCDVAQGAEAGRRSDVVGTLGAVPAGGGWRFGADEAAAGQLIPVTAFQQHGSDVEPMGCLRAGHGDVQSGVPFVAAVAPTLTGGAPFDRTGNSRTEVDALVAMPTLAFTCKDHGQDVAEGIAPTLRAMQGNHANAGGQIAIVFGGNNTSGPIDIAPALNACASGSRRMDFESEAFCVTGPITHTLKAEGADASEDGTGRGNPIVAFVQNSRSEVRRLMPVECERLQGLPDGWTQVPVWSVRHRASCSLYKEESPEEIVEPTAAAKAPCGCKVRHKPAEKCPDGPRYRAIGNGWAIPQVRFVARRLVAEWRRLDQIGGF